MIISDNNTTTSIRGFFLYSPSARYEEGDFVVYGNTIYVCSPKGEETYSIGEVPNSSKNFYVYLGDQMADVSEFINFSESGGGEKKYVSMSALPAILNNYMAGLTNSGIIGNTITYSDEVGFKVDIENLDSTSEDYRDPYTILANIMVSDINHGIFKVSRLLPEIKNYVYSEEKPEEDYCILKQYTYIDSNGHTVRVQELIDHNDGFIFYRTAPLVEDWYSAEDISQKEFKFATVHTKELQHKANNLFRVYSARLKGFETRLNDLQNNFRFSGITVTEQDEKRLVIQDEDPEGSGYVPKLSEVGPITVTIFTETWRYNNSRVAYESNSLTIDPSYGDVDYYINDDLYLSVDVSFEGVDESTNSLLRSIEVYNDSSRSLPVARGFLGGDQDVRIYLNTNEFDELTLLDTKDENTEATDLRSKISLDLTYLFEQEKDDEDFIAIDYTIERESEGKKDNLYSSTAFFRESGLSDTWTYSFDANRGSSDKEFRNYLITNSDFLGYDLEECKVIFSDPETFKFTIVNDGEISLETGLFSTDSSVSSLNPGDSAEYYGFPRRSDRGLFFSSVELNPKLILSIISRDSEGNEVVLKDGYYADVKSVVSDKYSYGTYDNPIITYSDLAELYKSGSEIIVRVVTSKTGKTTIKNSSTSDPIIYYLVKPGTSEIILDSMGSGYIPSTNSINIDLSEYNDAMGFDIKLIKALYYNGNDLNYNYKISASNGSESFNSEDEVLTLSWNYLTTGSLFDVSVEKLSETKNFTVLSNIESLAQDSSLLKISLKEVFDNCAVEDIQGTFEISEKGDSITCIYHPGRSVMMTLSKVPMKSSEPIDCNNHFFYYTCQDGEFYNFSYESNERSSELTGNLEGVTIELSEREYYDINLFAGSSLNDVVLFTTEETGDFNSKVSPITLGGEYSAETIKFYPEVEFTKLYVSRKVKAVVYNSENEISWIGLVNEDPDTGKYYFDSKILKDDCYIMIEPSTEELEGLGFSYRNIQIQNNLTGSSLVLYCYSSEEGTEKTYSVQPGEISETIELGTSVSLKLGSIPEVGVAYNVDSDIIDLQTTVIYDSDSWNYGIDRDGIVNYYDFVDIDDPTQINLVTVSLAKEEIFSSVSISELRSQRFILRTPAHSSTITSYKVGDIKLYPRRPDLGFWLEGLEESEVTITYAFDDEPENNVSESYIGVLNSNGKYNFGSITNPLKTYKELEIGYSDIIVGFKLSSVEVENSTSSYQVVCIDKNTTSSVSTNVSSGQTENIFIPIGSNVSLSLDLKSTVGPLSTAYDITLSSSSGNIVHTIFYNGELTSSGNVSIASYENFKEEDLNKILISEAITKEISVSIDVSGSNKTGETSLYFGYSEYKLSSDGEFISARTYTNGGSSHGLYIISDFSKLQLILDGSKTGIWHGTLRSDGKYYYGSLTDPLISFERLRECSDMVVCAYSSTQATTTTTTLLPSGTTTSAPLLARAMSIRSLGTTSESSYDIEYGLSTLSEENVSENTDTVVDEKLLRGQLKTFVIELKGQNSDLSKIASVYYRKYFK